MPCANATRMKGSERVDRGELVDCIWSWLKAPNINGADAAQANNRERTNSTATSNGGKFLRVRRPLLSFSLIPSQRSEAGRSIPVTNRVGRWGKHGRQARTPSGPSVADLFPTACAEHPMRFFLTNPKNSSIHPHDAFCLQCLHAASMIRRFQRERPDAMPIDRRAIFRRILPQICLGISTTVLPQGLSYRFSA